MISGCASLRCRRPMFWAEALPRRPCSSAASEEEEAPSILAHPWMQQITNSEKQAVIELAGMWEREGKRPVSDNTLNQNMSWISFGQNSN